eukprot:SM000056S17983  [mRNA]  locus=s56:427217:427979:+ [translate_table: standard]
MAGGRAGAVDHLCFLHHTLCTSDFFQGQNVGLASDNVLCLVCRLDHRRGCLGRPPGANPTHASTTLSATTTPTTSSASPGLSTDAESLLRGLLCSDPAQRITASRCITVRGCGSSCCTSPAPPLCAPPSSCHAQRRAANRMSRRPRRFGRRDRGRRHLRAQHFLPIP